MGHLYHLCETSIFSLPTQWACNKQRREHKGRLFLFVFVVDVLGLFLEVLELLSLGVIEQGFLLLGQVLADLQITRKILLLRFCLLQDPRNKLPTRSGKGS